MKKIKMSNYYYILSILTVLLIGLLPFSVKADTADIDTHFDVRVVETAGSKKGVEAVEVSVKNITNQTGKNVKATVELPKLFADKLKTEAVTRTLGTLEAGESKSFIIKLSDSSTTTDSSKKLPTTGETIFKGAIIVGVVLLIVAGFILRKRKLLGLLIALLALTGATLVSASTYNHKATYHHQVKVVGQTLPFTTVVTGDFEEETNNSSDSSSTNNSSSTASGSSSSQSSTASSDSDNPETPEEPVTKYTVTFVNGGNSDVIEVEAYSTVSEPSAPAKTGYRFDGWYETGAEQPFDFSTPIIKDTLLTAQWMAISYNITYELGGGTNFAAAPTSYNVETATITLGIPTRAGYTFEGWYTNSDKTTSGSTIAQGSTGDKTFYAKWTENYADTSYWKTVTYNLNGESGTVPAVQYVASGSSVTLASAVTPSDNTKEFLKWRTSTDTDGTDYQAGTTIESLTADLTLYAIWRTKPVINQGEDEETNAGDTITLGDTGNWRILKITEDNKYLVIKEQVLTAEETGTGNQSIQFDLTASSWNAPYFHNATSSTGYGESNLKSVIDTYYTNKIAPTYSDYVLSVDIDLPNWTRYSEGISFSKYYDRDIAYDNWYWSNWSAYYTNSRFATSLTALENDSNIESGVNDFKKQAFALSLGDIQSLDKSTFYEYNGGSQSDIGYYTTLLDFYNNGSGVDMSYPYFWLRSAGYLYNSAGSVIFGNFDYGNSVNDSLPVRPALWISLD